MHRLAEGVGFEPTVAFTTPVFKTGGLNRFPTPPKIDCDGNELEAIKMNALQSHFDK